MMDLTIKTTNHNRESGHCLSPDEIIMQRALDLSLLAIGRTSPNPLVGCVIVRNGKIVGEGYHQRNKGFDAATTAIETANLLRALKC